MGLLDSLKFRVGRWRALRAAERGLAPPTPKERARIDALHAGFAELPIAPIDGLDPNEADWNGAMNRLRQLGMRADPRAFQRWDVIVARMAHMESPATAPELAALRADAAWESRWRDAIREVDVGRPSQYALHPSSSEALIQTVYHVRELEELSERRVDEWDVVVEFGGGFGGLCRVMHALGFRGRYLIFDLPAFTLLQRYYLDQTGVLGGGNVRVTSDLRDLDAFVNGITPNERAVFWATWSLSETPMTLRERIKPLVQQIGNYCIAYQGRYGDVDNVRYFADHWISGESRIRRIEHRPDDYYLAGRVAPVTGA
ncbi:MAG TPA: putative sugar O-methyltransferase [Gemmatimonadaceae bacterium]